MNETYGAASAEGVEDTKRPRITRIMHNDTTPCCIFEIVSLRPGKQMQRPCCMQYVPISIRGIDCSSTVNSAISTRAISKTNYM